MKSAPGTVNVVSMAGGHTIVLLLGHETAGQRDPSMPQVRDSITATLRGRREQLLRTAYLSNVRGNADRGQPTWPVAWWRPRASRPG